MSEQRRMAVGISGAGGAAFTRRCEQLLVAA